MEFGEGVNLGGSSRQIAKQIAAQLDQVASNTASIRALRKRISKQLIAIDRNTLLSVAHELIQHARFGRFVAYELVKHHERTLSSITRTEIEELGHGMRHWGEVDTFSCYLAGPAWRMGLIAETVIQGWVRSRDWCWRRAALVSTVPLNAAAHGGKGDTKRTLAICRMLVDDRDDMVVKAMSWALRTLAMRDAQAVRRFLADHPGELGARVIREVNNKLMTGLKNPRKRRTSSQ